MASYAASKLRDWLSEDLGVRHQEGVGTRYRLLEGLRGQAHEPMACAKELCWSMLLQPLANFRKRRTHKVCVKDAQRHKESTQV